MGLIIKNGIQYAGSGKTSDYNDLLNKPFINIKGESNAPIILNQLNYGEYLIEGSFVYTIKDTELKTLTYKTQLEVIEDSVTGKKVAKYHTVEDKVCFLYVIYFNDDETCLRDKIALKKSEGILFTEEESLPTQGSEKTLYITEQTIYQWINGQYVDMNSPKWAELS